MVRECEKLSVKEILGDYEEFAAEKVELYIDSENKVEIIEFLNQEYKKVRRILFHVFKNQYNRDLYGKEEFSGKTLNITAMKFKGSASGSRKGNERIYCREYFVPQKTGFKKVVLIALYAKRETDKKTKTFVEKLGGYDYGF
ncbi:MAG: hypothetical protein PHR06_05470 [Candidatus Cloacimonetes bacterium]|nr:hypothetical protein [Candidatus Cloacimonadota bacterium]